MYLRFNYIVNVNENTRSCGDRRFKITSVIVSYIGDDGQEYRKRFEAKGMPIIPKMATHTELNALKKQF